MLHIKCDSRKVLEGDTFIAIGEGHKYVEEAIKNGASKVVVEYGKYSVETTYVKNTRKYLVKYLKKYYYNEIKDINLIGITGTNGKTTTCYLIYQALNMLGSKCGYIGTIGFYLDKKIKDLDNTTPDILDLYEMLLKAKSLGYKNIVMEVSSHSISMKRIETLKFNYIMFTNLTRDHLNYHKTMNRYFKAKKKLTRYLKKGGVKIVNIDDRYMKKLKRKSITIGRFGEYKIGNYYTNIRGTEFYLSGHLYKMRLVGKYNVYNMTFVIALLKEMGYLDIDNVIKRLNPPSGRLQRVTKNIFVDYAHTPDAVEKVIDTVKEFCKGNVITILGCGGNRDKSKRVLMSDISTKKSYYSIFTMDNPRKEDPNEIIKDMTEYLSKDNYEVILNREEAIKKGIQRLEKNDILLVLGKGHEKYQIIGNVKYPFDDVEIIKKYIRR